MRLHPILVLAFALFSSGCAVVESRVTVFHTIPATAPAGKASIIPLRPEIEGLEFASYAEQFAAALRAKGFTVGPLDPDTKYAAFLDYGIDNGQLVTTTRTRPQFGVTGSSGSTTTGTVTSYGNTARVNATTTNIPTFGVTGYVPVTNTTEVFARYVTFEIFTSNPDMNLGPPIYEGSVRSEGSCGNLASVMPNFIFALMADFPGETGGRTEQSNFGQC